MGGKCDFLQILFVTSATSFQLILLVRFETYFSKCGEKSPKIFGKWPLRTLTRALRHTFSREIIKRYVTMHTAWKVLLDRIHNTWFRKPKHFFFKLQAIGVQCFFDLHSSISVGITSLQDSLKTMFWKEKKTMYQNVLKSTYID